MSWLRAIEALKPGDACNFRFAARAYWKPAVVVENGGSGYWKVQITESFLDEESGSRSEVGDIVTGLYIEQIRCPDQTEAWAR